MSARPATYRRQRPTLLPAVATLLAFSLWGCAGTGPLRPDLRPAAQRPRIGAVVFLCDGLQPDLLERGCREGWLPTIQEHFVAGGTRVEHAITTVPSITYAAIATLLTGVPPEEHRILGNRWFDPDQRLFRDYATIEHYRDVNADIPASVATIYERTAPLYSVSIQAAHMRGVSRNIANWAQSGVRWYFGAYTGVDALTAETVAKVAREANRRAPWPALLTCYFPGLDTVGHLYGPGSPEYRQALEHLDSVLGRVCNWLEAQGLLETTYLVLVSDHGMMDVGPDGYVDLTRLVRDEWGRKVTDKPVQDGSFEHRRRYFDRFDTVIVHQDGRKASLYFTRRAADVSSADGLRDVGRYADGARRDSRTSLVGDSHISLVGWDGSPDPVAVEQILAAPPAEHLLWNLEGVALVAYLTGEREAALRSPRGQARVVERDTDVGREYRYVPAPNDVLGYLADADLAAFVQAGFHSSRAWLEATCDQPIPDFVPHIVPLLRERRSGQVLAFAAPGHSFARESGGHGGIQRAEMRVPLIIAGPGIEPGGTITCARTVDLVPTLLPLLGVGQHADGALDGVPLFDSVHASGKRLTWQP